MAKGHFQAENIVGMRFHDLMVVKRAGGKWGKAYWECKCDCGNTIVTRGSSLRLGRRRSCGCKSVYGRTMLDREEAMKNRIYRRYKRGCWQREKTNKEQYEFLLTKEEVYALIMAPCWYCGVSGSNTEKDIIDTSDYVLRYNGIDRVDNAKPYIKGNVVSCCVHCNKAKNSMTLDEFREWIKRVYETMYFVKEIEMAKVYPWSK